MAITRTDFNNAFREVIAQEFSHIPNDENSIDFTFSEKFERQMQRLIRSQRRVFYSFVNTSYKRVATVLVVLLTTAVTLFSIKPVRDGTFNFLGGIYNSLNQNYFEDNTPDNSSNNSSIAPENPSSNPIVVIPNNPSSSPDGNGDEVKYRLIYAKESNRQPSDLFNIEIKKDDNLVDKYLKKAISQFEGQDNVYFRVKVSPVVFYEEMQEQGYTQEKGEELRKQRIEYVKELGAKDMVLIPNTAYTYYASLNAEMIEKIEQKGGCILSLAAVSNPDKYPDAVDNIVTIEVTEDMDIP